MFSLIPWSQSYNSTPASGKHWYDFCSYSFAFSRIWWNLSVYNFFIWLFSLFYMILLSRIIHVVACVSVALSFLLISSNALYGDTILFILSPVADHWVFSNFSWLWIKFLWTFGCCVDISFQFSWVNPWEWDHWGLW